MAFQPQLVTRDCDGIQHYGITKDSRKDILSHKDVRSIAFSRDGKLASYSNFEKVVVLSTSSWEPVMTIPTAGVRKLCFSPQGGYIMTWSQYSKSKGQEQGEDNVRVYDTTNGNLAFSYIDRKSENWEPGWLKDESRYSRMVTNEIQFIDPKAPQEGPKERLQLDGLTSYSISLPSGNLAHGVVTFVAPKKSQPAKLRMYTYPAFNAPVSNKSFFKVDKVRYEWNASGSSVLVLAATDADQTGKSYYGETNLYLLGTQGSVDCRMDLDKEGPIYDMQWNPAPGSNEFIVVYGNAPSKAMLFNGKGEPVFDFGTGKRNCVKFNPQGNIICIAGFGALPGQMEIWLRQDLKKHCELYATDTTHWGWCPDGRHIFTATCSPRLRVSNGFTIWHYAKEDAVSVVDYKELFEVQWMPSPGLAKPAIGAAVKGTQEPSKASGKARPLGAYVPPHLRGKSGAPAFKLHDESDHQSAGFINSTSYGTKQKVEQTTSHTKAAEKNRKKREAKKQNASTKPQGQQGSLPTAQNGGGGGGLSADEKLVRNLKKKLDQITKLKKDRDGGKQLEANQLAKIETEGDLEMELNEVMARLKV
eukprot:Clim_evm24s47 gene=Clim_evmTU24s47